jgi:hypothetical protein
MNFKVGKYYESGSGLIFANGTRIGTRIKILGELKWNNIWKNLSYMEWDKEWKVVSNSDLLVAEAYDYNGGGFLVISDSDFNKYKEISKKHGKVAEDTYKFIDVNVKQKILEKL